MRLSILAASAAVLSLVAGAALADPASAPASSDTSVVTQGVAGLDYGYDSFNQGLGHVNVYGGELGGIMPLGQDFSGQINGGYHRVEGGGLGANDWNVAGTVAWDQSWGRLGANVGYADAGLLGADIHATNYGVYGEYYAPQVTVGARGGGVTATVGAFGLGGSSTGGYGGVEGIGYISPDLSLSGNVGLVGFSGLHQSTAGVRGEWLVSETTPISAWVGYDYASLKVNGANPSITGNTVSIGVKWYIGGNGTLEHRQRTGQDDWADAPVDLLH